MIGGPNYIVRLRKLKDRGMTAQLPGVGQTSYESGSLSRGFGIAKTGQMRYNKSP